MPKTTRPKTWADSEPLENDLSLCTAGVIVAAAGLVLVILCGVFLF